MSEMLLSQEPLTVESMEGVENSGFYSLEIHVEMCISRRSSKEVEPAPLPGLHGSRLL